MTKEPSVCRTSLHLGKVIVQTKINIQGAATLAMSRSLMTKEPSVCRTSLHLGKVIVQTKINIQGA